MAEAKKTPAYENRKALTAMLAGMCMFAGTLPKMDQDEAEAMETRNYKDVQSEPSYYEKLGMALGKVLGEFHSKGVKRSNGNLFVPDDFLQRLSGGQATFKSAAGDLLQQAMETGSAGMYQAGQEDGPLEGLIQAVSGIDVDSVLGELGL